MMHKSAVKEILNMVEENVEFESDRGGTEVSGGEGDDFYITSFDMGQQALAGDVPVILNKRMELEFQVPDGDNMFQGSIGMGYKYLEAVSDLSVLVAKAAKEGMIVSRPLAAKCPGGTKNEDGSWTYTSEDFNLKPRPGSAVYVVGNKLWIRHESRYDSRKKATLIEIDILYGILT